MLAAIFVLYLMAMTALGVLITISSVGKPRGAVTPALAAYTFLVGMFHVAGLGYVGSQL